MNAENKRETLEGSDRPVEVLVIGGGFGGLNAARSLGGAKGVHVTLIDRRNHHLFQPLLYQVAMAALSPADIAAPIRSILSGNKNIDVLLGRVESVDLKNARVQADFGELTYDYLILACGASHSYFGRDDWEPYAPGLKSLEEATEIRRRMLTAFEKAERETDPQAQKELLTFVVVGGGPTGVELAGALGEISRFTLTRDFRNIDPKNTRVILVEGGGRILPTFSQENSDRASRGLEKVGVQIWTNCLVTDINESGVGIGKERINARTVLWAAGVKPADINKNLGVELGAAGRVIVEGDLSIKEFPNVFVVGDQANFSHNRERPLPGLAPVAIQQGRQAARNIVADLKGRERQVYKYLDKGSMATIGRASAVVEISKLKFGGLIAWLAWLLVHIFYLIGFKNRVVVLFQWSWSYLTFRRGARLITLQDWRKVSARRRTASGSVAPASKTRGKKISKKKPAKKVVKKSSKKR